ncbi:MAG: copper resistance [Tardiphaga sp.]|nr:copper resistance [Tardiphaga sp.]
MRYALAAFGLVLVVAHSSAASAHASLIASDPVDGATLAIAPATLTLSFNEPVEPIAIRIIDGAGTASAVTQIGREGANLVLRPPAALGEGAHIVSWRVISADGHPVGGSLTFWIGARGETLPQLSSSDSPKLQTAIWIARLAIYLGLFVGAGGAFFAAWIQLPAGRGPKAVSVATSVVALAALALSIGLQGLDVLGAAPSALASFAAWLSGARGSFGVSAAIAAAALVLGLFSLRARGTAARAASLAALAGAGLALAATGHAAKADPRLLTTLSVFLHGASLAFWIGALVPLGFAISGPRDAATDALMRFSRWIPLAIAALLASGVLLAIVQLSRIDALWTTDYGLVLSAKIVLVGMLLALALWNRLRLTPHIASGEERPRRLLRRSIAAELVLVVVILGIVGLWRFTPPPRALASANDDFFTHLHTEKAMANVTISPGHAGPIVITIQLETSDERPLAAAAVSVTLSNPDVGIEPAVAQARRMDDGRWRATMAAPVAGRWTLALGILISDFDKISIEAPIVIK